MGDELLECRQEIEEIRKRLTDVATEASDLSRRAGLLGFRLGELARQSTVPTATHGAGWPCADYRVRGEQPPREAAPDVAQDDEVPVGHVEPVPASAMIPPRELNRADRGAE